MKIEHVDIVPYGRKISNKLESASSISLVDQIFRKINSRGV